MTLLLELALVLPQRCCWLQDLTVLGRVQLLMVVQVWVMQEEGEEEGERVEDQEEGKQEEEEMPVKEQDCRRGAGEQEEGKQGEDQQEGKLEEEKMAEED